MSRQYWLKQKNLSDQEQLKLESESKFISGINFLVKMADYGAGIFRKTAIGLTVLWYFSTDAAREKLGAGGFMGFLLLTIAESTSLGKDAGAGVLDLLQLGYKYSGHQKDGCCNEPEEFWNSLLHTDKSEGELIGDAYRRLVYGEIPAGAVTYAMVRSMVKGPTAYVNAPVFIGALALTQVPNVKNYIDDLVGLIDCCGHFSDFWSQHLDYFGKFFGKLPEKSFKELVGSKEKFEKLYEFFIDRGLSVGATIFLIAGLSFFTANLITDKLISKQFFPEKLLQAMFYTASGLYFGDAASDVLKGLYKAIDFVDEKCLRKVERKTGKTKQKTTQDQRQQKLDQYKCDPCWAGLFTSKCCKKKPITDGLTEKDPLIQQSDELQSPESMKKPKSKGKFSIKDCCKLLCCCGYCRKEKTFEKIQKEFKEIIETKEQETETPKNEDLNKEKEQETIKNVIKELKNT